MPEANHKTRARARIAARIRERAGEWAVDRREGTARAVESSEKLSRGGRRGMEEHLRIRRIKQVSWARRGKSRGQRDVGLKSTTRHGASL